MIYFIRHPETTWNTEGRMQGSKEGKITAKTKHLVKKYVDSLTLKNITHIYYASNNRTRYLAHQLKEKYPNAILEMDIRLNERDCGIFEGMKACDIFPKGSNLTEYKKRFYWKPSMGESHVEVSKRIKNFFNFLQKNHSSSYVICVTSAGVLRNLIRIVKGLSLSEMYSLKIPNLSLIKL